MSLSEDASRKQRSALRRLAGFVSQLGEDVVNQTLAEVAGGAGEELAK